VTDRSKLVCMGFAKRINLVPVHRPERIINSHERQQIQLKHVIIKKTKSLFVNALVFSFQQLVLGGKKHDL